MHITRSGNKCTKNALDGMKMCKQHQDLVQNRIVELSPSPPPMQYPIPQQPPQQPHPLQLPSQHKTFQLSKEQVEANERLHNFLNRVEDNTTSTTSSAKVEEEMPEEMEEEPQSQNQSQAPRFDPRSFKSKAVDLALEEEYEPSYDTPHQQIITENPAVGLMCGGYFIAAGFLEQYSKTRLKKPLTGFERRLRESPEIQMYLPIVMQNLADKYGLEKVVTPEMALLGATATIALSCYASSEPNVFPEQQGEVEVQEEEIL